MTRRTILGGVAALYAGHRLSAAWEPPGEHAVAAGAVRDLVIGAGAWCWFQTPRAAFDRNGTLWVGSSQGTAAPAPGAVDVSSVDLATMRVTSRTRMATDRVDDHTSPSVLPTPAGIQVGWAAHRQVDWLELGRLGAPLTRIHRPAALTPPGRGMSYVSAHLVGDERWVLYRGEQFSWNLLTSADGEHWTAHGLVVAPADGHRPYVTAAADGGRLHIVVSDGNPSEFPGTNVWVGSVDDRRRVADAQGRVVGSVGAQAPRADQLTRLEAGTRGADERLDTDVWVCDTRVVHRRPTCVLSVRDPWPVGAESVGTWRHRYRWARQRADGGWTVEHLAWAGGELYERQPDYTGLASIDPTDPERVVVSTNVHPSEGTPLRSGRDGAVHWELFEGQRTGEGRWEWAPITHDSLEDHLRPVLVADHDHRAVVWMRGRYRSWGDFDTQLVVRHL